ncbi:MAG: Zn-ribbon domain-containing OB-fold protein [Myxococcota bacterium]
MDNRPLPTPTALSRPHWEGCKEGKLRVQRCTACGTHVFIPQPICTACQSDTLQWVESTGQGTVYSYTIVHRPPRPEFEAPYIVAIVELEEGWFMLTNLVGCEPGEVSVGMRVSVEFEERSEEISLPVFRRG